MPTPKPPTRSEDARELSRRLGRMTRRGFAVGGGAMLAGYAAWKWIGSRAEEGMLRAPLRRLLEIDETIARSAFDPSKLSRSFPATLARLPRVNGRYGIDLKLDLDRWRVTVEGPAGTKLMSLAEIRALPRFEVTTELRCIEGWSEIVTWAGARLSDLAASTGLARRDGLAGDLHGNLLSYVGLETPDAAYFVGLDMPSALHPQTLLCYEMNGEALSLPHGAPLRLAIPVKYGIKNLKQIGKIRFTDARPPDFWASKGYDWYAGL